MANRKQPEIRFDGYTDDWEQRKLGEFTKLITKGTTPKVKSEKGTINFVKVENLSNGKIVPLTKILQDEHDGYLKRSKLEENDILFSIAGTLGRTAIVKKEILPANTNQALAIIRGYEFDTNFLITSLNGHIVAEYIRKNPTVGAQPNLSLEQVGNLQIKTPTVLEQKKIGQFFKQLDDTIALHQRKLELLKEQKKGFLQKMFPKAGANVPEVRFAGFTDDWELRKFEDLLDSKDGVRRGPFGSALKKEFFVDNSDYVVYEQQNAIYDNYHTRYKITKEKFDELSKFKLTPGDFIMSGAGTIGRISRVPEDIQLGVFNQALIRFRLNTDITDSEYFIQFVRADFMQKNLTGANPGSAITNLVPMSEVKKWAINVPKLEEQQKIGAFFKQLDDTIALHQQELDLLKETKKGFLQKMFV